MIAVPGLLLALGILSAIVVMLVRRQLREKYAVLWLVIGTVVLVLSVFPGLLLGVKEVLGVEIAANLIFALSLVLLVGVCLHLSWELSRAEEEIRRLAEEQAILRVEVEQLAQRVDDGMPRDGQRSG